MARSPLRDFNTSADAGSQPTLQQVQQAVRNSPIVSILKRGVVVEAINDVALLTQDEIKRLSGKLETLDRIKMPGTAEKAASKANSAPSGANNLKPQGSVSFKEKIESMPRNSIIARIVSLGEDNNSTSDMVCYPLFPPHLCFPVKAGEQVWIMQESLDASSPIGYWVSRITEPDHVDDLNFTHADRKFINNVDPSASDKITNKNPQPPGFNNGDPDGAGGVTLVVKNENEKPYEDIFNNSTANKSFSMEAVPRFTKRPGDLVLQGSNNTLVCLGQDRGWTKNERPGNKSNASSPEPKEDSGTIDIVTGRGRRKAGFDSILDTCARVIKNVKNKFETNKNPQNDSSRASQNRFDNPAEGDPDFLYDASRVYVSTKTDGDKNFSILDSIHNFMKTKYDVKEIDESPYIVLKSNEIRIIARHSPGDSSRAAEEGSIKIVKEGPEGKICSLVMTHDGKILIDADKIVIGNGKADQIHLGSDASESAVLGDKLVTILTNFCNTAMMSRDSFAGTIVGLPTACTTLKSDLASIKSKVTKVQ